MQERRLRLRKGDFLVFPKDADPTTDKTCLYRVIGFDKLGRPRVRHPRSVGYENGRSVHKQDYHNWRVTSSEGLPKGELRDCMDALNAYWQEYPEDREAQING